MSSAKIKTMLGFSVLAVLAFVKKQGNIKLQIIRSFLIIMSLTGFLGKYKKAKNKKGANNYECTFNS